MTYLGKHLEGLLQAYKEQISHQRSGVPKCLLQSAQPLHTENKVLAVTLTMMMVTMMMTMMMILTMMMVTMVTRQGVRQ